MGDYRLHETGRHQVLRLLEKGALCLLRAHFFFVAIFTQLHYDLGLHALFIGGRHLLLCDGFLLKAGSDNGYAQLPVQRLVVAYAEDHIAIFSCLALHVCLDDIHFIQRVFKFAFGRRDVDEYPPGAADVVVVQQRGSEGILNSALRAVFAFRQRCAEDGYAAVTHNGANVGKVHVDLAGGVDNVRNTFCGGSQHVVRFFEGGLELQVTEFLAQFIVGDNKQGIYILFQAVYALIGL